MSSSVRGVGGTETMYRKHWRTLVHPELSGSRKAYLETLVVFLLLLVNYPETKVYLVCLFKIGLHAHDLREGLFCILEGAIAIVENADAIPQFGLLRVSIRRELYACRRVDKPLDHEDDIRLVDRPSRPVGDRPSSNSSVLFRTWSALFDGAKVVRELYLNCPIHRRCCYLA